MNEKTFYFVHTLYIVILHIPKCDCYMYLYDDRVANCICFRRHRDVVYGNDAITDGLSVGSRHASYSTSPGVQQIYLSNLPWKPKAMGFTSLYQTEICTFTVQLLCIVYNWEHACMLGSWCSSGDRWCYPLSDEKSTHFHLIKKSLTIYLLFYNYFYNYYNC